MAKKVEKILLSPVEEEYLDIYHKYFVLNWDWTDIAKYHKCNKSKVEKAVHWVIDNKLKFPSKELIKGAIDAISARLKTNKDMYLKESTKKRYRDNGFIVSLSREVREDEKMLYELQEIYSPGEEETTNLSAGQVLNLTKEASKTNPIVETNSSL